MKTVLNKILIIFAAIPLLISCKKGDVTPADNQHRTVIVYMISNNDSYDNAIRDINEMEKGWKDDINGNLVVYINPLNSKPYLINIQHDSSDKIVSPIVKEYPNQNSSKESTIKMVFEDVMKMYPSKSYGAILWADATGWLPTTYSEAIQQSKSFGNDNGSKMEISELAQALPNGLDFIIFDACMMSNIEVVYELKNKADYIMGTSTQRLSPGYPYDKILPYLFCPVPNLTKVAYEYFNYYDEQTGTSRSATISLIKTSEIDKLAQICKKIVNGQPAYDLNYGAIQNLDTWAYTVLYDFGDFIRQTYPNNSNLKAFEEQLNKAVIYKNNTPLFFNKFPLKRYYGLSAFIPNSLPDGKFNSAFLKTKWSEASGLSSWIK